MTELLEDPEEVRLEKVIFSHMGVVELTVALEAAAALETPLEVLGHASEPLVPSYQLLIWMGVWTPIMVMLL